MIHGARNLRVDDRWLLVLEHELLKRRRGGIRVGMRNVLFAYSIQCVPFGGV